MAAAIPRPAVQSTSLPALSSQAEHRRPWELRIGSEAVAEPSSLIVARNQDGV